MAFPEAGGSKSGIQFVDQKYWCGKIRTEVAEGFFLQAPQDENMITITLDVGPTRLPNVNRTELKH